MEVLATILVFAATYAVLFGSWKLVEYLTMTRPEKQERQKRAAERQQLWNSQPVPSDQQLDELFKDVDFDQIGYYGDLAEIASRKLGLGEFPHWEEKRTQAHQKLYDYVKARMPKPKPPETEFPRYLLKKEARPYNQVKER